MRTRGQSQNIKTQKALEKLRPIIRGVAKRNVFKCDKATLPVLEAINFKTKIVHGGSDIPKEVKQ